MSKRITALQEKCSQYPYHKSVKRLSEAEFDVIVDFIEDHDELAHLEFEYAVNRMFLDGTRPKSKNWAIIMELLTVVNTAAYGLRRSQP